ncbi:MAG: hypothetical protein EOM67_13990, partial [Spirochaetia bacterium]|nr:hypothetical protein [Spirochaetia bacterium]
MFVYINEIKDNEKNSKDIDQSIFHYMAITSTKNLDLDLDRLYRKILKENELLKIQSGENFNTIESLASDLLKILRSNSISCFYSIVEKDFLSYAKMYENLFDNFENKGTRSYTYQIRELRLFLISKLMEIVPVEVAHSFYEDCLCATSQEKAIEALKVSCDTILSNIHLTKDERAKQIISDALTWAKNNPAALTSYHTRKVDRWLNLPHVASFLPLMGLLSDYSKLRKSRITKITYDDQDQVRKVLEEIDELSKEPAKRTAVDFQEDGAIDFSNIKHTSFETMSSSKSFGLQTVDMFLYI